ncbi:MAG: hypothetical protein WA361_09840 [Candidatus Acidiferrales bacterium]
MENIRRIEATSSVKELTGIGGWLSFRILIYIVFVPAQTIYYLSQPDGTLAHFFEVALGILCLVAGIQLFRLKAVGVKLAKIAEGSTIAISILALLVSPTLGIRGIVGGAIWLMYFYKSVRVRNTYLPQPIPASPYATTPLAGVE